VDCRDSRRRAIQSGGIYRSRERMSGTSEEGLREAGRNTLSLILLEIGEQVEHKEGGATASHLIIGKKKLSEV